MSEANTLKTLDIAETYSSQAGDLIGEFYNPVLSVATCYDRITGFFSPKVLAMASRGFARLIKTGGKIRLVTSVEISSEVFQMLQQPEFLETDLRQYTEWNLDEIKDELERNYLAVFSHLLSTGQLEMKIAVVEEQNGILHQKIGIITDAEDNSISFSGSNNETLYGWGYNIEEFKVFKNWELYSYQYYQSDVVRFVDLWNNTISGVKTIPLSVAAKNRIIRETQLEKDITTVVEEIEHQENELREQRRPEIQKKRQLFDYQQEAIDFWFDSGCVGIFEMATGTGKTFTAMEAMRRFQTEKGSIQAVVVVPLASLVTQWYNELLATMEDCIILATSNTDWRNRLHQIATLSRLSDNKPNLIIVTTYSLFNRDNFKALLASFDSPFLLVADEMHNLVTANGIKSASSDLYNYRLGLSATPSRLWRPKYSARVSAIFNDKQFVFPIKKAIERGFLVPFNYYPQFVELSDEEFMEYIELSLRIRKKMKALMGVDLEDLDDETLKNLLIRRASIKKEASAKIDSLQGLTIDLKAQGQFHHALIYADNEEHLAYIKQMLNKNKVMAARIVGDTPKIEREHIIKDLEENYISAITAIKCLDEGIDIPSAQKAFILSNNTDPREYVQRLGRVLRVDRKTNSKKYSDIYDFIVMPPANSYGNEIAEEIARNLVRGELIRARFFAEIAMNGEDVDFELFREASDRGFVYRPEELCYNNEEEEL